MASGLWLSSWWICEKRVWEGVAEVVGRHGRLFVEDMCQEWGDLGMLEEEVGQPARVRIEDEGDRMTNSHAAK